MGLDDLSSFALVMPVLALLFTIIVSAPATLASHLLWKRTLSQLAERRPARLTRPASLLTLLAAGAPAAYSLLLTTSLPGLTATIALLLVTALAAAALIHAAYRVESIKRVASDPELAETLASVPYAAKRREQLEEVARESALPAFTGDTRRRALALAAGVLVVWCVVAGAVFLAK